MRLFHSFDIWLIYFQLIVEKNTLENYVTCSSLIFAVFLYFPNFVKTPRKIPNFIIRMGTGPWKKIVKNHWVA